MGLTSTHSDAPHPPLQPALWQQALQRSLAAVAGVRRRQLRSFTPSEQGLIPSDGAATSRPLLDLASNDYLGLSRHPQVTAAAAAELQRSGLGSGASRLVSGSRPVHDALETALAGWLGRERALLFPSGFQANLAAVVALSDRHSLVLADRLIHHSLLVGVQASGAKLQRFRHNDLADLARQLRAARTADPSRRLLVLSESLFSMEGTSPAVPPLCDLCQQHGAGLLLDEAHGIGVMGPGGRGLGFGHNGIGLISGTLGKALGSGGAFLAGDEATIETLLQCSGAFRYTTALAPPLAAGALAALNWIAQQQREGQDPALALLQRAERWRQALVDAGWPRPSGNGPILPLLVGDDAAALALQSQLERAGLLSIAIRPPTVPEGRACLRLVLRRDLPAGTLPRLLSALGTP
ncbi:MAG: aminotransferase class I/II-fold pyridoxal phosphate-dependent enzyme [Cyanobacteriota bacterium]|nr:aminotransferase class I/II-fold pyridoxal phosphate-dependent enzyme [Cyanobacteriota bacterium]